MMMMTLVERRGRRALLAGRYLKRAITATLPSVPLTPHPAGGQRLSAPSTRRVIQFQLCRAHAQRPSDPRDVLELRALAERQPELSAAASLQIELVDALRRIQTRIATASVLLPMTEVAAALAGGRPLLDFDRLPIDWTEARLLFRQITDILRRHDALDAAAPRACTISDAAPSLPDLARQWFDERQDAIRHRDARRGDGAGRCGRFSCALPTCCSSDGGLRRVETRHLSGVRRRARLRLHHHQRRSPADLRPLPDALAHRAVSPARSAARATGSGSRASRRLTAPTASRPASRAGAT